ncbi:MAG TPA: hypothetical protein PKC24_14225, partial [Cyclobacteriaceae bacterium]|nr:hypothetical protein [Cyclobacteriaceae bacterium]
MASLDTLAFFDFMDSLLQFQKPIKSYAVFRTGYTSNIVSSGRDLGTELFGLTQGAGYYHKSGLFAEALGYWSKTYEPAYYLTRLSLGFMDMLGENFTYLLNLDRFIFTPNENEFFAPPTYNASAALYFEQGYLGLNTDYSYYFGDFKGHRIFTGANAVLEFDNVWKIDRIRLFPGVNALLGNQIITLVQFYPPIRPGVGSLPRYSIEEKNVFGLMNWSLNFPVSVRKDRYNLFLAYVYNIPVELPGEELEISNNGFISATFSVI